MRIESRVLEEVPIDHDVIVFTTTYFVFGGGAAVPAWYSWHTRAGHYSGSCGPLLRGFSSYKNAIIEQLRAGVRK